MNLIEKVKERIERDGLIPAGSTVIVGVSGGADSVALLHILHRLGYPILAAHLNHGIRGVDADADEAFVKNLCAVLGVECVIRKTDVPALAKERGLSLEMAAREARHDFFRTIISSFKFQVSGFSIALAHHADDQLETFFLRAARGSGPSGLGGMKGSHKLGELQLVRPLLGVRRAEIIQWLSAEGFAWREDASNSDDAIPRNLIRHQILPMLSQINERAAENILRTMGLLRDEEVDPEKAARRRAAREWLIGQGLAPDFDAVEQFVEFAARTDGSHTLELEGLRIVNEYGTLRVAGSLPQRSVRMERGTGILRGPWAASISWDKLAGRELMVRSPKSGDRMNPYGMEGTKKLQDIFTDLKIPKAQRESWPVVECSGEIVWVPGYRIARGWELTSAESAAMHLFSRCGP